MASDSRCWECRRRRVHCDASRPSCAQCSSKGWACPGYSPHKPLKWRHRVPTFEQTAEAPQARHVSPSESTSLVISDDITSYYNTRIAPDNSPDARNTYYITQADWQAFDKLQRHLYTCIVLLHKIVKSHGSKSANQDLLLQHQTAAARELYEMIRTEGHIKPPVPRVVEGASMFLCSQIQFSAFGKWRMHLNGAKSLIHPWREEYLGRFDFALFHMTMVDIYGTTTAPSSMLSEEVITQHHAYTQIVKGLTLDPLCTLVPIPTEVMIATIIINQNRARTSLYGDIQSPASGKIVRSAVILQQLQEFDPEQWAQSLASENARSARSWVLLATCYRSANILYLFQSDRLQNTDPENNAATQEPRRNAHRACIVAITEILHQRQQKGTHYKFILWPMVICGIESAALGHRLELQFLCQALEAATAELGTNAHLDAAEFLKELWKSCEQQRSTKDETVLLNWDEINAGAPIFLM